MSKDSWRLSKYNKLVHKLKAYPDSIEHTEAPIENKDILRLIELSKTMSKSEAIQFAVNFTIENFGLKDIEEKLEKLRYAKEEVHEASGDLLES